MAILYTAKHKHSQGKRVLRVVILLVLLAGSGFLLDHYFHLAENVGEKATLLAHKFFSGSADNVSAEPVLRGTIYDRNFKEMAVSYRLFSVYAHPRELTRNDKQSAAQVLSDILQESEEAIIARLNSSELVAEIATDVDKEQVRQIENSELSSIYCKEKEVRFYPYHTTASMVLGFVDNGVGLSGIEGSFDTVLQPGEFKRESAPVIDFEDQEVLGKNSSDLILTLDLELQKHFEKQLQEYLAEHDIEKGVGFILEPFSGKVLAAVNQPSFNPNYFWQYSEQKRNDLIYKYYFKKELIDKLIVKAAAIYKEGLSGTLLPQTVAAPDYGLEGDFIRDFEQRMKLQHPVGNNIQILPYNLEKKESMTGPPAHGLLTPAQIGVALASLVNGGWRITPNFIEGIFDHFTARKYIGDKDTIEKQHVLEPVAGVVVRKKILKEAWGREDSSENSIDFTFSYNQTVEKNGLSDHVIQDVYVGFSQADRPRYLVVIATAKTNIYPQEKVKKKSLLAVGRNVLDEVKSRPEQESIAMPAGKSEENYRRFLIGKRVDYQEAEVEIVKNEVVMPEVKGLSLRKALQRLNQHEISIRVNGSGIIVAQTPSPGEPIDTIKECTLTLESEI